MKKNLRQTKKWVGAPYLKAIAEIDFALADLMHRILLPFSFIEDKKMKKVIDITRRLPAECVLPNLRRFSRDILTWINDTNWYQETKLLVLDARIFGVTFFEDGATIKTVMVVNDLGAGVHYNLSMLDVFDCFYHCYNGDK